MSKLTPSFVKQISDAGSYQDGRGLILKVNLNGQKRWVFRYQINRRRRDMGIGTYPSVSLREARLACDNHRVKIASGIDPLAERENASAAEQSKRSRATQFQVAAESYIKTHRQSWSEKHASQWSNSLEQHAYPHIGGKSVGLIDTDDVLKALLPIWSTKPVTASRVRNRIELVLDAAKAKNQRDGENPARWRGHLDKLLPKQRCEPQPFASMPAKDVVQLMRLLDSLEGTAARCCELLILTALRSSEACNAQWSEFDIPNRVWTIPAARMKGGKDHRVPLTDAAILVLDQCKRDTSFVFPNARNSGGIPGNALLRVLERLGYGKYVVHGFRATFRTWAAEETNHPREVCEMALAHSLGNKVEAAYNRGDLLDKRRSLMNDWALFVNG
jgi:integrase